LDKHNKTDPQIPFDLKSRDPRILQFEKIVEAKPVFLFCEIKNIWTDESMMETAGFIEMLGSRLADGNKTSKKGNSIII
jgi:hypothetical protein